MDVTTQQNAFREDLLSGKTAIVTGASRGIGRGNCAETLRSRRERRSLLAFCRVSRTDRRYTARQRLLHIFNGRRHSEKADVEALIEKTIEQFSQIDILVNNAGITRDMTNLTGTMYCTRAVLRPMIRQKSGRIINISSVIGLMGNAGQASYAAAKAGIIGLTKATAKEVGARGITVNAIAPGFITTDMTAQISEEHQKQLLELIPVREFGHPEDVADAACFLVSDAARYITGQILQVDGGMVM
ncbi:3-oxoacyl-[acyl-carrier-protein] reductase FabG [Geodia barretti]|uniref:3-ketoacyl-[acyl-carrier-protein] reductase beta subunit n=1 Tax=Geodia barretti TaxID=519541 RepID=A0AA35RNG1_GEOBA|nr:3-oxoacyl-[acyl-carrier-protein] reductase FabG [Geodia barretti]